MSRLDFPLSFEGPASDTTFAAGSRPLIDFSRSEGPTQRNDVGEAARSVSPRSGLSGIKREGTGGRGPPAEDVSAHSGLKYEPIAATMFCSCSMRSSKVGVVAKDRFA